jgi:hypothetical protein
MAREDATQGGRRVGTLTARPGIERLQKAKRATVSSRLVIVEPPNSSRFDPDEMGRVSGLEVHIGAWLEGLK